MQDYKIENTLKSIRPVDLSQTTKEDLINYFINTWNLYDTLFSSIKEDAWQIYPDPLRRPIMWYLGHTAALYINKCIDAGICGHVNEWFEKFFKTGVDPIYSEELDNEVYKQKLPSIQEVWAYRKQVYNKVIELIKGYDLKLPINDEEPMYAIILGTEHERIHYETSTLLIRQMPVQHLQKPEGWKYAEYDTEKFPQNEMITVPAQQITYGKNREFPTYGWDCEYGKTTVDVKQFKASKFLITNGEYLEFFKSGGYNDQKYWQTEGWEWKQRVNRQNPLFWVIEEDNKIRYRAMFDIIDMPLNWPVDVNYHEARAYCAWKGPNFRVIKESEFNIIRGEQTLRDYGKNQVEVDIGGFDDQAGNVNIKYGSSCPVDSQRKSPLGFYDCYGNVWEWSEDYYKPLPGFKINRYYPDYSGGCFDQKHNLLMGSAWSSTGLNCSSFFRVAFRRHFYQNCGFRLVEETVDTDFQEKYADKEYLNRYLHFNFATNDEFINVDSQALKLQQNYENYPVKVAQECIKYFEKIRLEMDPAQNKENLFDETHALDLGCGMGRTAFELAKKFTIVTGVDYAQGFIDVAEQLKEKGEVPYQFKVSGELKTDLVAKIDKEIERERLVFLKGDAMNLPTNFGPFDLIIASNLIDRLSNPLQCLIDIHPLLKFNGILIITSPYTWMEEITSKNNWVGAKEGQTSFEALQELMHTLCFQLVEDQTLTLLIKEHARKYELIMPHMTVWKKREFSQEFATSIFKAQKKY